jgi:outer membrane protein OmpA-like peptidoglycan-associated protein
MNARRRTAFEAMATGLSVLLLAACQAVGKPVHYAPPPAGGRELERAAVSLRAALKDTDVVIEKVDGQLLLRLPAAEVFEPDSSTLRSGTAAFRPLADIGKVLERRSALAAEVRVYTDTIGGSEANQMLAASRATAIVQALTQLGVAPTQLTPQGMGAAAPVASNESPEGRRANRRVEIVLSGVVASSEKN